MVLQHLSMLLVCFLLVCLAHGFDRSLSPKNRTVVPPTVDSTSIKNVLAESLSKDPNAFAKVFAQIDPSLYHGQILGLEAILDELKDEKKSYEDEKVSADKANATAHDNLEVANNDLDTAQANFNAAEQIQDDAANEAIIAHTKAQIATEAFEKHTPVLENEIEVVEGVIADLYGLVLPPEDAALMDFSTWNAFDNSGWLVDLDTKYDKAIETCNLPSPAPISGWAAGSTVGVLEATFTGAGQAVLTYGNGFYQGTVTVYLNGVILDKAVGFSEDPNTCPSYAVCSNDPNNEYKHDGTRVVHFPYQSGDVLRIVEGFAIICLHSLVLTPSNA